MNLADADLRRLLESRHDLDKVSDAPSVTGHKRRQGAVVDAREVLSAAREAFVAALGGQSHEQEETAEARHAFEGLKAETVAWYDHLRRRASGDLLNPAPDVQLTPVELERRQRAVEEAFGITSSDLARLGPDALAAQIERIVGVLDDNEVLRGLALPRELHKLGAQLSAQRATLQRELNEDRASMDALRQTRDALDRAAEGHRRCMAWVLYAEGREDQLGRYVKALEPGYRARLASGRRATEEPGVEVVLREGVVPLPGPPAAEG